MNQNDHSHSRLNLRRGILGALSIFAVFILPLFYQNCSDTLQEGADASSVAANLPFAFDTVVDQVAYMSCSNMPSGYDTNAFFTFKAGAYGSQAGIKLNPAFKNAARNLIASEKVKALAQSDANHDAIVELALRPEGQLNTVLSVGGSNLYAADFIGNLTRQEIASLLVQNNGVSYINNFPPATPSQLVDTIHFTQNETLANTVRTGFNAASAKNYLALTYNRAGGNVAQALGPAANSPTSVYGTGFRPSFAVPNGFTTAAPRVMSSLQEYNLVTGAATSAVWDCKPDWRFVIVRQQSDLGSAIICDGTEVDTPPSTPNEIEMYQILRRMLPFSDWGVNLARRCLVPKKTGLCYGNNTNGVINYGGGVCDSTTGTNCPHYVSLCRRRS